MIAYCIEARRGDDVQNAWVATLSEAKKVVRDLRHSGAVRVFKVTTNDKAELIDLLNASCGIVPMNCRATRVKV